MQKADYLLRLMKQRTDALVASDEKLQKFLLWINEKSLSVEVPYKLAAVRAFYLVRERAFERTRTIYGLDLAFIGTDTLYLDHSLACTLACARAVTLSFALDHDLVALDHALALSIALSIALDYALEPELKRSLQQLKEQLSDFNEHEKEYKQWWEANGQLWTEQLRSVMIKYCDIGHDWHFSEQQKELLQQYYDANKLLIDCLNSCCNVTPAVRNEIEETLLLPTEMLLNAEG